MRQTLVPVLLLVVVTLSSSKVLELLPTSQLRFHLLGIEGQKYDNTYSLEDKYKSMLNNIFYEIPIDTADYVQSKFDKSQISYSKTANKRDDYALDLFNKKGKRNGDGFRRDQWHNYPRQLDRLHKYLDEQRNYNYRYIGPYETVGNHEVTTNKQFKILNGKTNGPRMDTKLNPEINYDIPITNIDVNPFLSLKLRLACFTNNHINFKVQLNPTKKELRSCKTALKEQSKQMFSNRFDPIVDFISKIRNTESPQDSDTTDDGTMEKSKTVTKRIFSLWSRAQGLSHKGHEILQRRRHMHTFYGMPDGDGSRLLTAETRAILMRPPGSPLRWG